MAKKDTIQSADETNPPAQQPQTPGLTLQDLVLVAQIIQLTSQRGAFKAEELEQVGGLYNKLIAFLQSVGALAPAQTEEKKND
jgi:hypothetical protein